MHILNFSISVKTAFEKIIKILPYDIKDKIIKYRIIQHLLIWVFFIYYVYFVFMEIESDIYKFKLVVQTTDPTPFILFLLIFVLLLFLLWTQTIYDIRKTIFKKVMLFIQFILMIYVTSITTFFWTNYLVIDQKFSLIILNLVIGFFFFTYFEYLKDKFF